MVYKPNEMCNIGHTSSNEVHHHLNYLLTDLLTSLRIPWNNSVLLEKLIGLQLLKFPAFYGTRRIITAFTSAPTCPYPKPARSSPYPTTHFLKIHLSIILPSRPGSPKWSRTKSHVPLSLLRSYQSINPGPRRVLTFRNKASFYGEELSSPCRTPKRKGHPLSFVRDCLFNIFAATLHIGSRSSIRNLRTRLAVVTGIHLPPPLILPVLH